MEEIFNSIRPIISGLVGALFVLVLILFTKDKSRREGNTRHLHYGKPFKIFSLLLIPTSVFIVYAVSQSYKGQEIAAFLVATGFVLCSIFLPYQAFFVSFSYDDEFVYYKSPWIGFKKVPWSNLKKKGYSIFLQSDFILVDGIGRIWLSNMLDGYTELCEFLEKKSREINLEHRSKNNMIKNCCLLIETSKFPILDGEEDEIINENMYGKAICLYLEEKLPSIGISVPFFCNEDWGWWLETNRNGFEMALCIYSDPDADSNPQKYAILPSIRNGKKWYWSKFKSIDHSSDVLKTIEAVEKLFKADSDIRSITRHDDFPF